MPGITGDEVIDPANASPPATSPAVVTIRLAVAADDLDNVAAAVVTIIRTALRNPAAVFRPLILAAVDAGDWAELRRIGDQAAALDTVWAAEALDAVWED